MWMVFHSGDELLRRGLKGDSYPGTYMYPLPVYVEAARMRVDGAGKKNYNVKSDVTTAYSFHQALEAKDECGRIRFGPPPPSPRGF